MADETKIEWCDSTLNLWFGCTQISPACDHCYAMRVAPRLGVTWNAEPKRAAESAYQRIGAFQRGAARFRTQHGRRRRVFINSLSDFFDNQVPREWRDRGCQEFESAPDVIIILVTKRPENVRKMVPVHWLREGGWPENVWLLVTGEDQHHFDRRVAHALLLPAPVVGVSIEPMLEQIAPGWAVARSEHDRRRAVERILNKSIAGPVNRLGWLIYGGESGRHARPMPDMGAIAESMSVPRASHVPVFFKQRSQADFPLNYNLYESFPACLKIRQWPAD